MSNDEDPGEQGSQSPLSRALHEKVEPLSVIGASVFIIGFLALIIVKLKFPENSFVREYLRGFGVVIAIVLLWCTTMAGMASVEWLVSKKKAKALPDR